MSPRRIALASIAVVTVLCVVGVSIVAVAAGGSALAYEVNGHRVSQHDFDNQLDDLAHSDVAKQASKSNGSIDSRATSQVLTLNIARDVLRDTAERRGVKVTAADRSQAKDAVGTQLDQYPDSYRGLILELRALGFALGLDSDDAFNTFLARQFARADVRVDPRYGHWSPKIGVCPPTGCSSITSQPGG